MLQSRDANISPGSWSYQDYLQTTNWSRPEIARIHSVFLWLKPLHVSCASFLVVLLAREDLGNKDAVEFFTAAELRSGRTRIQAERHVWAHRLPQQQNEREDTNCWVSVAIPKGTPGRSAEFHICDGIWEIWIEFVLKEPGLDSWSYSLPDPNRANSALSICYALDVKCPLWFMKLDT